MEFEQTNKYSDEFFEESVSIKSIFETYLIHLKWFVLSVLVFATLAFLKIRYEVPQYYTSAQVLIKKTEKGNSIGGLSSFQDMGIFGKDRSKIENEIAIMQSRRLTTEVIKELNLNIQYLVENEPYNLEQYPDIPFIISSASKKDSLDKNDAFFYNDPINKVSAFFSIMILSNKKFEYFSVEGNSLGVKSFGNVINTDFGNIIIELNENKITEFLKKTIHVVITPLETVIDIYNNSIVVEAIDEKSDVLNISLKGNVPEKSVLIINNLIEQYNADAVEDKAKIYNKTTDFLNERINLLTNQLSAIETSAEQFKTQKGLVDVQSESGVFLESSSINERKLINANTQLQLIEYMINELNNNKSGLLPANIGLSDPSILNLIREYNILVLRRNRILKSSTSMNPLIVEIDSQLSVLKNNLKSSLNTLKSSIQIQLNSLNRQSGKISSKIASVPRNERLYKDIIRQQETKNALYLFLLQKREESEISKSVTVENARIINAAYSSRKPISPKKTMNYLASIIMGLFLPFAIIFIKDVLDTKVHDENDIKKIRIPYIGDIPLTTSNKDLYISENDNSNIAEAFRYIRTNINFMLDSKKMGKTVFVTSTQSGEGKSFTAINLASSLAISGKKTVLLAMDLRAPKILEYLDIEDMLGVTNFIKNKELSVSDIIDHVTKFDNLDIISSGDIPPNPVELLMSKRVKEIFEHLNERYEYIIVDTAPVGLVTDTIQISKFSDLTIYVIKANFLDKRMLHIPEKLNIEKKLKNMSILINGTNNNKGAYGYGYGYGNKKKKLPWYQRVFK